MKTILVFVSTLDGKVTKWGDPHVKSWSSKKDQEYFNKTWKDNRLIIMGSNTFNFEPVKADPNHLLVIMTKEPFKYKSYEILGQLEFRSESPVDLAKHFEMEGHENMLIVGGPHIATSFLKKQLVDELWLTIEPKIFGAGGNFVIEEKLDINLQLISCESVNKQGTLFTKYAVIKDKNMKLKKQSK
ncbi:MAG TPA: dihydrofolate reductase family protein [Ignavibacteria bacterium]